ncbi:MAG TPA: orotidine-5'-phosphate decarboxylase [Thermomicrobiales bacterium]|nr:orotidine-5'-phosphate decarboxylase [Thermomicrobiales bacterium]
MPDQPADTQHSALSTHRSLDTHRSSLIAQHSLSRFREAAERNDSLLCVGLDPDVARFPAALRARCADDPAGAIVAFNRAIVEATADLVCAYKPNLGFYAAFGPAGLVALAETRRLIPPAIPALLDAKVNDIGHTAAAYATGYFDAFGFDAVTANPYLGEDALQPFLERRDRGVFVLCRTSNPGSGDLQGLAVAGDEGGPLYETVARRIAAWGERYGGCGAVVGATYPRELAAVRAILPDAPILVPGIGAQGGALAETVRAGLDADGFGLAINASRAVTYASAGADFADAARRAAQELRAAINAERANVLAGRR